jgi:hypothetical protein
MRAFGTSEVAVPVPPDVPTSGGTTFSPDAQTGGYFICSMNARKGVPPVVRFPGEAMVLKL